jgi:hypothetical protein
MDANCEEIPSVGRLVVKPSVVPSSSIFVTLMKEALSSSETSVLSRATRRNMPEDTILHSQRREYLKSYIALDEFSCGRSKEVVVLRSGIGEVRRVVRKLQVEKLQHLRTRSSICRRALSWTATVCQHSIPFFFIITERSLFIFSQFP